MSDELETLKERHRDLVRKAIDANKRGDDDEVGRLLNKADSVVMQIVRLEDSNRPRK